jgi:hypothetical protein
VAVEVVRGGDGSIGGVAELSARGGGEGGAAAAMVGSGWQDGCGVEVVLGNGRRVRVGSGFDAEVLVRVVGALEGMGC